MKVGSVAIVGGFSLLLGACTGAGGGAGREEAGPAPPPVPSEALIEELAPTVRPPFAEAQKLSDQIKVGMPQSTVEAMFGRPDKAGFKTYGRATETPWQALVWEWVFDDVSPPRVLSIAFQDAQGEWLVNHGDWP